MLSAFTPYSPMRTQKQHFSGKNTEKPPLNPIQRLINFEALRGGADMPIEALTKKVQGVVYSLEQHHAPLEAGITQYIVGVMKQDAERAGQSTDAHLDYIIDNTILPMMKKAKYPNFSVQQFKNFIEQQSASLPSSVSREQQKQIRKYNQELVKHYTKRIVAQLKR